MSGRAGSGRSGEVGGGGGARAILHVTDRRECHRFSILHKSHMAIPDHKQCSYHRSKFLKKANYKSRKKDLCQKFTFVPAPSFIVFQSLFELKMKILKTVLF